ncbi:hypothetical protein NDU88_001211 [Pleurodeles waltl]|uniref:Uncharacterized protein n=1 Tax=Pleurodeles waltl TaxID=8319 RepID=A0AAV7SYU8_PLEWA|nr:hypothetical protein NDU88_001211 [Pleurodeles waltl]
MTCSFSCTLHVGAIDDNTLEPKSKMKRSFQCARHARATGREVKQEPRHVDAKLDTKTGKEEQKGDQTLKGTSRKRVRPRKENFYTSKKINMAQETQTEHAYITIDSEAEESINKDTGGTTDVLEDLKRLHLKINKMPKPKAQEDKEQEEALEWVVISEPSSDISTEIREEEGAPATGGHQEVQHPALE